MPSSRVREQCFLECFKFSKIQIPSAMGKYEKPYIILKSRREGNNTFTTFFVHSFEIDQHTEFIVRTSRWWITSRKSTKWLYCPPPLPTPFQPSIQSPSLHALQNNDLFNPPTMYISSLRADPSLCISLTCTMGGSFFLSFFFSNGIRNGYMTGRPSTF